MILKIHFQRVKDIESVKNVVIFHCLSEHHNLKLNDLCIETYTILPLIKKLHFIENHDAYDNIIIIAKYVNFK